MLKYLPRVGWERFQCFEDGSLIDPSNEAAMRAAYMFRWAFVIGWGVQVWWAVAQPVDQMQRLKPKPHKGVAKC